MKQKHKKAKVRHECTVLPDSDSGSLHILPTITVVSSRPMPLNNAIQNKSCFDKPFANDFSSVAPKKNYQCVQDLKKGLTVPSMMYTDSLGSNFGKHVFIWEIPQGVSLEAATVENMRVINQIKQSSSTYHSRALRRDFINKFGLVTSDAKSHMLRQIYHELTGMAFCTWILASRLPHVVRALN